MHVERIKRLRYLPYRVIEDLKQPLFGDWLTCRKLSVAIALVFETAHSATHKEHEGARYVQHDIAHRVAILVGPPPQLFLIQLLETTSDLPRQYIDCADPQGFESNRA